MDKEYPSAEKDWDLIMDIIENSDVFDISWSGDEDDSVLLIERQAPEIVKHVGADKLGVNDVCTDTISEGEDHGEVLRGVTFTIPAGQLVAIVGPSGSGKTTCLRLMNGFYDPPQGTVEFCCHQGLLVLKVRVSGVDIRHVTGAWLRARIAFVQQQTTLLGATVADAIRFGVAGSDADVTDVAKIAGVHDVIDQMPKRYATPLSSNISDDVRKRLAIARALLTNPDILLLDSCFSSMAPDVEGALLSAIAEARPECTVVVVTSRQKTLESASHIVVLESGVAVEEGSLVELLRQRQWLFQALRRAAEARSVDAVDAEEDDTIDEFEPAASELGPCPLQAEHVPHRRRASSDLGVEEVGVLAALGRSARLELISVNPVADIYRRLDFYTKIFLIAGCLSGTSLIVQGYTMAAAGSRLTKRLRQSLFDAMLHQELTWFEKEENDIESLLHLLRVDAANVQKASGEQLALVVQLCSVVWASALLSLYYNWQLGALTLGLAPLLIYALLYLSKTVSRRPFDELEELNKAEAMLREALGAVRVVVSDCAQPLVAAQLSAELRRAHAAVAEALGSRPLVYGLALATPTFGYAACAALGAHLFTNGLVSYEDVFRVLQSLILGTMLASQLAALAPNVLRGELAAARVMGLLSKRSLAYNVNAEFHTKWSMRGNIRFYKVGFRPGPPQLREFSLQLREGQSVALVGPPGCGRSLPVPLLLGFYRPTSGTLVSRSSRPNSTPILQVHLPMGKEVFGGTWFTLQEGGDPFLYEQQQTTAISSTESRAHLIPAT
ncbi:ATP-binding cassette sub-family B member 5-like [Schistocerca gregaria]|uniref:ATP-binding cassette sub-family B member 5-like n=1 Tax=Schistocerca gregaria TaxID=7010 RepID=UPI00211E57DC|nr:ATP-binding cassette sub-family B member 5-like [Schistocerca gregaria]